MNKAELVEAIAARTALVDKKTAAVVLEAMLTEIQNAVTKGDKVFLTGFGVFERHARAARMARNPRTGEAIKVKKTTVPAFRPGADFKEGVATGKAILSRKKTAAAAKRTTAKVAPAKKTAAKAAPAKKALTKQATAEAAVNKTVTRKAVPRNETKNIEGFGPRTGTESTGAQIRARSGR